MVSITSGYKIGRSTASVIIKETTTALWIALNPIVLKPINFEKFKNIERQFYHRWKFPHTLGPIDGKHIAIQCPPNSGNEYFNYKKHFSVILLAICDTHYNFTYVNIGAYRFQSDGGVLATTEFGEALSNLRLELQEEDFLPNSRIKMPYFLWETTFCFRQTYDEAI